MDITPQSAGFYLDMQSYETLRKKSHTDSSEALHEVSQQFEALFIQMLLKAADKTHFDSDLFGSHDQDFYRDIFNQQLAVNLSKNEGIGLAKVLEQQLKQFIQPSQKQTDDNEGMTPSYLAGPTVTSKSVTSELINGSATFFYPPLAKNGLSNHSTTSLISSPAFESPNGFVHSLWPYAEQASQTLGVSPQVILAQAALETGWGKEVSVHSNLRSSHNLFNIKADNRWSGETVSVSTLEYVNDLPVQKKAVFRSYASYKDSFDDYVNFLQSSKRYQSAIAQQEDQKFLNELQRAGYATDPNYAAKINRVVHGEPMQKALENLKI